MAFGLCVNPTLQDRLTYSPPLPLCRCLCTRAGEPDTSGSESADESGSADESSGDDESGSDDGSSSDEGNSDDSSSDEGSGESSKYPLGFTNAPAGPMPTVREDSFSKLFALLVLPRSISWCCPSDACPSAGGIPGIESSNGQACCLASCGQCGGMGCSSAGKDTDCCISDIVASGEACSVKGSAPCYIGDGKYGQRVFCCVVNLMG